MGDPPIGTRVPPPGEEAGYTLPGIDRFIESWAPWRTGGERHHELCFLMEFDYVLEGGPMFNDKASDVDRYPHKGEDTEGYLEETESETDTDWEIMG